MKYACWIPISEASALKFYPAEQMDGQMGQQEEINPYFDEESEIQYFFSFYI